MTDLAILTVKLEAESSKLRSELDKANKKLDRFGKKTSQVARTAKKAFIGLAAGLTLTGAIRAMDGMSAAVDRATSNLDNLGKASRRLGLTTGQLQEIRILAEAAGVETQTLDTAFQRFARRVGSGNLDKTFKELNISIRDSEGGLKSNIQLWDEFGRKISALDNENRQLALAMKAVDTEGVKLVELWRMSGSAVDSLKEKMNELGLIYDEKLIAKAERYQTELGLIRRAQTALHTQATAKMAEMSLDWERLKLKIIQAKNALLEYFFVQAHGNIKGAISSQEVNKTLGFLDTIRQKLRALEAEENYPEIGSPELEGLRRLEKRLIGQSKRLHKVREEIAAPLPVDEIAAPLPVDEIVSGAAGKQIRGITQAIEEATGPASVWLRMQYRAKQIIDQTRTPFENYIENMGQLTSLYKHGLLDQETFNRAAIQFAEQLPRANAEIAASTENLAGVWKELGGTFSSAFEDAIVSGNKFSGLLKGLEQDIIRIFTRRLITMPLTNMLSGVAENLFGSIAMGMASGGMAMAGKPHIVGERGPELFVPNTSGTIVPNHQIAQNQVTINQTLALPPGTSPEAYRQSARQGALEGSRLLQTSRGIA